MSSGPRPPTRARVLAIVAAVLLVALSVPVIRAGGGPKVVVIVGPVGSMTPFYREEAREVVAEARRHTSNVVYLATPDATWRRVKAAARGASVLVFFGHGNGHPSRYGQFRGETKNGLGLDPPRGANGWRHINYGEDRIREGIRLAPDAAVLLYRLCYASGNTEPGLSEGSTRDSRERVDGYASGFLAAGAGIVFADGHPKSPGNYMRQLFRTDRTMLEMFRAAPNFQRHQLGPFRSRQSPGSQYALDPDRGGDDPSGFYRSVAGNLELTARAVTKRPVPPDPSPTPEPSPSGEPSPSPTDEPTEEPTDEPTAEPTDEPTPTPEPEPTAEPTDGPMPSPEPEPTAEPTDGPMPSPEPEPTATREPTPEP